VTGRLGVCVGPTTVRAVHVRSGRIDWTGEGTYETLAELRDLLARLAVEAPRGTRGVRLALEPPLVQLRTVPAPVLSARRADQYVQLEQGRLFRRNGAALVVGAKVVREAPDCAWVVGAAVEEPVLAAVVAGCEEAGLTIDDIAPSAEVVPAALPPDVPDQVIDLPLERGSERVEVVGGQMQRARFRGAGTDAAIAWAQPLQDLNGKAPIFGSAYGAGLRLPRLSLLPPALRRRRARHRARRAAVLTAIALVLWVTAAGTYVTRLAVADARARQALAALAPLTDSVVAVRRELAGVHGATRQLEQLQRGHVSVLELLARLTAALDDSVFLTSVSLDGQGRVRVSGYAPTAVRVAAALEDVPGLAHPVLEGSVSREGVTVRSARRDLDRFTVAAQVVEGR
jgi:Tfp pilus assembly protein PilN